MLRKTNHEQEAEEIHLDTLSKRRKVLGNMHPDTLTSINNLAELYIETDRPELAHPLVKESYEQRKKLLGENHSDTLESLLSLARLQLRMGNAVEAEHLSRTAFEQIKQHLGYDPPVLHSASGILISALVQQKKNAEALELTQHELTHRRKTLGDKHPTTLILQDQLQQLQDNQPQEQKF